MSEDEAKMQSTKIAIMKFAVLLGVLFISGFIWWAYKVLELLSK